MKELPLTPPARCRRFLLVLSTTLLTVPVALAQSRLPVQLPDNAKGAAAISALGAHLPDVAQAYGLSSQRLATLLRTQPALGVDRHGLLLFACDAPPFAAPAQPASTSDGTTTTSASLTATDAFRLHSFPGATRVIYLDFDGHTTTGTQWNAGHTGGAAISSAPFDIDGSPGTFGAAERAIIHGIWQRVAEDYAAFAVNVTTEDPGIEALRKSNSSDSVYGVRVVISPTNWYNTSAGGVGYVGSFTWNSDTPCFVFAQQLANGEKYIAECAAHEAGHTLKLYHDGTGGASPSGYYMGHGNWAPIMGAGYYRAVTQFSRGEYANANNTEDDLAIIATSVPYATDDHGDTPTTASTLNGLTVADGGTIERATDVDMFRFTTGAGLVSLVIQGPSPEPNLDVKAELLNANSQVIQTSDLVTLGATINTTLAAGTYYLRIRGTGAADPASSGYSSYGSVGNYVITGTLATAAPPQAPTAVAAASITSGSVPLTVAFSSQGSSDTDGTITGYHWNFGNGATSTAANPSHTYTSAGTFSATLTVTDNNGLTGTASVQIVVSASSSGGGSAPVITAQPVSQTAAPGSTAIFSISVSGTPAPTVQWYRNGITFSSWTGTTLVLYGLTTNDVGTYTAVVTNSAGSVTSAPATLSLGNSSATNVAPSITSQPTSQMVAEGANVTFNASASGSPTPSYQWHKDGAAIPGATQATLNLNAVTPAHSGNYTLVATNAAGSATSNIATLTVNSPTGNVAPTITSQPTSQSAPAGTTIIFRVGVSGTPTPTIQWYRDGVTFSSWTGPMLILYGITAADVGNYTAVVSNPAGSVTSVPVTLTLTGSAGNTVAGN